MSLIPADSIVQFTNNLTKLLQKNSRKLLHVVTEMTYFPVNNVPVPDAWRSVNDDGRLPDEQFGQTRIKRHNVEPNFSTDPTHLPALERYRFEADERPEITLLLSGKPRILPSRWINASQAESPPVYQRSVARQCCRSATATAGIFTSAGDARERFSRVSRQSIILETRREVGSRRLAS